MIWYALIFKESGKYVQSGGVEYSEGTNDANNIKYFRSVEEVRQYIDDNAETTKNARLRLVRVTFLEVT